MIALPDWLRPKKKPGLTIVFESSGFSTTFQDIPKGSPLTEEEEGEDNGRESEEGEKDDEQDREEEIR